MQLNLQLYLIRELAKKKNITLVQVAKDLDMTYSNLQSLMKLGSTSLKTLEKICEYFEVKMDDFLVVNKENIIQSQKKLVISEPIPEKNNLEYKGLVKTVAYLTELLDQYVLKNNHNEKIIHYFKINCPEEYTKVLEQI